MSIKVKKWDCGTKIFADSFGFLVSTLGEK